MNAVSSVSALQINSNFHKALNINKSLKFEHKPYGVWTKVNPLPDNTAFLRTKDT